jgi:hypothetical protein
VPVVIRLLTVPAARWVIAIVLWGLALTTRAWLKPTYASMANRRSFLGSVLRGTGVGYLLKGLDWSTHKAAQAISHHAAGNVTPLARHTQALALRTRYVNDAHARFAEATADSFHHLRFRTMPVAIRRQTRPIARKAAIAGATADHALARWKAERASRQRSISHINRKLGALALGFAGIDYLVKRHHAHQHRASHQAAHRAVTRDIPRLRARSRSHARRIGRLERLLGASALAAALTAVLVRAIPSWRCSNFRNLRRLLRCSHWRWLEALLFLAVDALTIRDLCMLVGYVERGAAAFQPVIHELMVAGENFVCGDPRHMPSGITDADRADSPGFASAIVAADRTL